MQVRAGGHAGGADIADGLTSRDCLTDGDCTGGHVRIQRLHSIAVVDHDIVAPAAVPTVAGAYDSTAVGSIDGAAVACCNIGTAVIFILASDRVNTGTLTAGYVGAIGRPDKIAGAGGAAAAASTIVIIPVRFFFGLLLLVELIYLGLNLRLESRLLTVEFAEDGGVFIDIGLERGDDCRSLSDIYLKLIL